MRCWAKVWEVGAAMGICLWGGRLWVLQWGTHARALKSGGHGSALPGICRRRNPLETSAHAAAGHPLPFGRRCGKASQGTLSPCRAAWRAGGLHGGAARDPAVARHGTRQLEPLRSERGASRGRLRRLLPVRRPTPTPALTCVPHTKSELPSPSAHVLSCAGSEYSGKDPHQGWPSCQPMHRHDDVLGPDAARGQQGRALFSVAHSAAGWQRRHALAE